jgi:hypothetical protein
MTLLTIGTESTEQVWEAIHDEFIKKVEDVFPRYVWFWDKIEEVPATGRQILFKSHIGGSANAKAVAERGQMPTPAGRLFKEYTVGFKSIYGTLDLTGQEMKVGSDFIDIMAHALEDCWKNFLWRNNVIAMGDGSGRICQVNGTPTYSATTGVTTITIDNGVLFHLREYEKVRFGADATEYTIQSIDYDNLQFTVGGNAVADAADDSWVYHEDTYATTLDKEPLGLKGHVSSSNPPSGDYQNLDRSATGYAYTQSTLKNQASAAMTEKDFDNFINSIRYKSHQIPSLWMVEPKVATSYKLLMQSRHQNVEAVISQMGVADTMAYIYYGRKIELNIVDDVLPGTIYAIDPDVFERRVWDNISWMTDEGNPKLQRKYNYDIYEGGIRTIYNIICRNPKHNGVWQNIKQESIT